jgi:hypothetical protein
METGWQERFAAVVDCVYCVLSDVDEQMEQIKESLFANRTIGPLALKRWPSASDTQAYALDLSTTTLCDMTNAVMTADKTPAVERQAIPATFAQLKECIEAMQVQVRAVEGEYGIECAALHTSMGKAVALLATYLAVESAEKCALLGLPDEALVLVVLKCCDVRQVSTESATHCTCTLFGPSCLIMCTNKRLRDRCKKDHEWGEKMAEKRKCFFLALFWSRVRFLSRAWGAVQRSAVLGLAARETQEHVLQKDGQKLEIRAEFVRRKRNKCHIALELCMSHPNSTGVVGVRANLHIDLPKAYATKPEKRTQKQRNEMRGWMRDRSSEFDDEFAGMHKHFVQVGRPIFAYW